MADTGPLVPSSRHPLAVTTSDRNDPALASRARAAAEAVGVPYLARTHQWTLGKMLESDADVLVVFSAQEVSLVDREGALPFSPGLAHLRIKRLDGGHFEDMLLRQSGLVEGDQVLDCTLGLAADAQVAARKVGPSGGVTALEKSLPLYLLVRHGLETLPKHPRSADIRVVHTDAHAYLRALPSRSFDVVLYDPMFGRKRKASNAFEALRRYADFSPLTVETVEEARRVARKGVVLKGSRYSTDFKKLGIQPEPARRAATVLWARVPPLPG